ncbi:MAG: hypothetical protein FWH34_06790, partial [Desulfovibrionaceae bacterium]|nr:hypothetical protein [Desulfovibrionaceae bacterium]
GSSRVCSGIVNRARHKHIPEPSAMGRYKPFPACPASGIAPARHKKNLRTALDCAEDFCHW